MIEVRVNGRQSGRLSKTEPAGSSFVYGGLADPEQAVSLTMPLQAQSYDWGYGLLPIFEMNLPEGILRAQIQRRFAKALGHFDDLDLLAITGRHQIGRIEYGPSPLEEDPAQGASFHYVDEILRARRGGALFDYLMHHYAQRSGISGVQPKVLIQDAGMFSPAIKFSKQLSASDIQAQGRASVSISSPTHIVKLWDPDEFPELAANEYFCLRTAQRAGLNTAHFDLSDSGEALVVERFDLGVIPDGYSAMGAQEGRGHYFGFEDFCVLNGVGAQDKYRGSYESKLFRRLVDYVDPAAAHLDLKALFTLFVLNCVLRNGDAHLKNFGLLYDGMAGSVRLAPVYDIVTTTAYLPKDAMALTLAGSTNWPNRAKLIRLGTALCELSLSQINETIEQVCEAVRDTQQELSAYFKHCPNPKVGSAMIKAWDAGLDSLR